MTNAHVAHFDVKVGKYLESNMILLALALFVIDVKGYGDVNAKVMETRPKVMIIKDISLHLLMV